MSDTAFWAGAGRWFDRDGYMARNPDVARAGIDPLAHYLRYGEAEGRRPSPWFDPAWYRTVYGLPDGQSALEHFLTWRTTGRFLPCAALYPVPHLAPWRDDPAAEIDLFDHYLTDMLVPEREHIPALAIIQQSRLIDPDYHALNAEGLFENELDPVLHYCRFGWRHGARPSDAFDPGWYTGTNPTALRIGIDPLLHYILEGEARGRRPVPWFDPAWYRETYGIPPDRLSLSHYQEHRLTGTVSPNPLFDPIWYTAHNGQNIPAGVDPFSHYLTWGAVLDIAPSPAFDAPAWRHQHMAPLTAEGQRLLPAAARNPLVDFLRRGIDVE